MVGVKDMREAWTPVPPRLGTRNRTSRPRYSFFDQRATGVHSHSSLSRMYSSLCCRVGEDGTCVYRFTVCTKNA